MTIENPKDGFDLIEYPSDYGFKAMCRVDVNDSQSASDMIQQLVFQHIDQSSLIETHTHESRTGKFESVTVTLRIDSRDQLEAIYKSIAESPRVVMTL
ncbi:MAG: putative lipoic acid-binding regulatory protein [Arenicella sp.]|jgi:putative lipoic acid-binding regulatory protein